MSDATAPDATTPDVTTADASTLDAPAPDAVADSASESAPEVVAAADGGEPVSEDDSEAPRLTRVQRLEQEGDIAADYLEELLDIADLDGDLDIDVDGDRAAVSIVGAELTQLVGGRGEVLDALQELTRLAVYRETGERSRLMLDISGYREARRAALVEIAQAAIEQARTSGEQVALDPMSPFERKVVHDAVADAGLGSESSGTEPRRFVVVLPT